MSKNPRNKYANCNNTRVNTSYHRELSVFYCYLTRSKSRICNRTQDDRYPLCHIPRLVDLQMTTDSRKCSMSYSGCTWGFLNSKKIIWQISVSSAVRGMVSVSNISIQLLNSENSSQRENILSYMDEEYSESCDPLWDELYHDDELFYESSHHSSWTRRGQTR